MRISFALRSIDSHKAEWRQGRTRLGGVALSRLGTVVHDGKKEKSSECMRGLVYLVFVNLVGLDDPSWKW
jgi:hypothetical protein